MALPQGEALAEALGHGLEVRLADTVAVVVAERHRVKVGEALAEVVGHCEMEGVRESVALLQREGREALGERDAQLGLAVDVAESVKVVVPSVVQVLVGVDTSDMRTREAEVEEETE